MRSSYSDIDIVRSCLCAASHGDGVHVNRLGHLAQIFGCENEVSELLTTMGHIGEAYHLGRGFWAPGAERCVAISDDWLIVSPLPTALLVDKIDLIDTESFGRFSRYPLENTPTQLINSWLKVPAGLDSWYLSIVNNLKDAFRPSPIGLGDVEVYFPRPKMQPIASRYWTTFAHIKENIDGQIFLGRKVGDESKYFWCMLRGRELLENLKPVTNPRRLRYAIERVFNAPLRRAKLSRDFDTAMFECYYKLPLEEERLVNVCGRIEIDAKVTRYYVPSRHLSFYSELLLKLGVELTQG